MYPIAPTLVSEFPEVENFVRFRVSGETLLEYKAADKQFYEKNITFADSSDSPLLQLSRVLRRSGSGKCWVLQSPV